MDARAISSSGAGARRNQPACPDRKRVVCLQIGARENYAVARALHRRGALALLLTDAWTSRAGPVRLLSRSLADRGHAELAGAPVAAASLAAMGRELWAAARGSAGWERVMARNRWFQEMAVRRLERSGLPRDDITLFAYSYAAGGLFEYARRRGWRTVLGQIDAGPVEARIVADQCRRFPDLAAHWAPAPEAYWAAWRDELAHADSIVVNSDWSRRALLEEGAPADRVTVIPLAYEPPPEARGFRRRYPRRFDAARPLRALFLGQVNLRKGLGPLLEAARLLRDAPVEFHIVGPVQITPPRDAASDLRMVWHGPEPRAQVHAHYRNADILVFPTLSDGFGLTQLEARAWRLPLIVTPHCGAVVEDGVTGIVVEPNDAKALAEAIGHCVDNPGWLQAASDATAPGERHGIDQLGQSLAAIA